MGTIKIALQALKTNRGRTILTVIGIVIGIAAVIIVMSAGDALKALVLGQLESFGSNYIQIEVRVPKTGKNSVSGASTMAQGVTVTSMKLGDAEEIAKLPNVNNYYAAIIGQEIASYDGQNKSAMIMAVSAGYNEIDKTKVKTGEFFTEDQDRELAKVVVLGPKLADKLFGSTDPVGNDIKLGSNKFRVIGVMNERGSTFGMDFDEMAIIPVQTMQKLVMGIDYVQWITAQIKDTNQEKVTASDIEYILRTRHKIDDPYKDDFAVTTMAEAKAMIDTIFNGITLLLIAIAGISLVVGGVGIMNIMYVSVTERTFEIGLRKAIGAKKRQILWQFLSEAVIITLIGGVFGIIIGAGASYLISLIAGSLGFSWKFSLSPSAIALAFGFCGAVGLVFGYYPASHAAKMDPISALRHE